VAAARTKRRILIGVAVALAVVVLVPVAGIAWVVLFFDFGFDFDFEREHLAPIPVAAAACPSLRPVRARATALHDLWWRGISGEVARPQFRRRLRSQLQAFELELTAAEPHVPAPIAQRFRVVRWHIAAARDDLARADGPVDALVPGPDGTSPVLDGTHALAEASDLVGTACGAPLYTGVAF
jgi:hypothetical protein